MHSAFSQIRAFKRDRAFTLIELLLVVIIIALLISILLPSLAMARKSGRKTVCTSNLRQFAIGQAGYVNDYKEQIGTLSARPGTNFSQYADLNSFAAGTLTAANITRAAAAQAVDIMRRRGNLDTTLAPDPNWTPFVYYSHLALNDYLAQRLPEPMVACPEDSIRLGWQKNPTTFSPIPGDMPYRTYGYRWAYSSSYQFVPASYSADKQARVGTGYQNTFAPSTDHSHFLPSAQPMGGRRIGDVALPSSKVMIYDPIARHARKPDYFAYEDTKQPLLFFDSSVRDTKTGSTNHGADPNLVNSTLTPPPISVTYTPSLQYEPPARPGQSRVYPRFMWTINGLRGFDLGKAP
jgi:prepilin-type N-terminal cleavage/methylation domain-containing protein